MRKFRVAKIKAMYRKYPPTHTSKDSKSKPVNNIKIDEDPVEVDDGSDKRAPRRSVTVVKEKETKS
jgi:hypothetical protein